MVPAYLMLGGLVLSMGLRRNFLWILVATLCHWIFVEFGLLPIVAQIIRQESICCHFVQMGGAWIYVAEVVRFHRIILIDSHGVMRIIFSGITVGEG